MAAVFAPAAQVQQAVVCSGTIASTGQWRVPFTDASYQITSPFGYRYSPISGASELHDGTDLAAPQTDVVAASAGQVTFAGWEPGFGNHVVIDHGAGITTLYGHLASIAPGVAAGVSVVVGQPVGVEGSTGWSTGIHLHFTIKKDGVAIDPEAFLLEHGAPLNGQPMGPSTASTPVPGAQEGGLGFELPQPEVRQDSLTNQPLPIPAETQQLYEAAGARFGVPWTLLAGVGMAETAHGRVRATSSAGAQGLMQFMPSTFAAYGIDGDGDGRADIWNDADSVFSAANYLVASGVRNGPEGVKQALFAYNHADWYVGDVLFYAHSYGGGQVLGGTSGCVPGTGVGDPTLPSLTPERLRVVLAWAQGRARSALPDGRQRTRRLRLLIVRPGRLRADRSGPAANSRGATQLARSRQRLPGAARPGTARRPDLHRLLPRTQPHRSRRDGLGPCHQPNHRGGQREQRHHHRQTTAATRRTPSSRCGGLGTSATLHGPTERRLARARQAGTPLRVPLLSGSVPDWCATKLVTFGRICSRTRR